MSTKETGGPAFPVCPGMDVPHDSGMTLRDYFAGQALQGYMANPTSFGPDVPDEEKGNPELVAKVSATFAYMIADAMLKARES